jgi:NAD-dependent DNA ligase
MAAMEMTTICPKCKKNPGVSEGRLCYDCWMRQPVRCNGRAIQRHMHAVSNDAHDINTDYGRHAPVRRKDN